MTVDEELAYEAVIELLAHQFAFPVKWIDTQDVLLGEMKSERIIEVGPSNTLTVMAKRTVASQFKDRDEANWTFRELLSCDQDASRIHFENGPPTPVLPTAPSPATATARVTNDAEAAGTVSVATAPSPEPVTSESSCLTGPAAPAPTQRSTSKKADVQITAKAILVAMIAQKVKRSPSEIRDKDSIKILAGGRSTLENELVGDIECEFAGIQIPDRAESLGVEELATSIQARFHGKLGKKSHTMIEKIVGSKMPAGFNLQSVRAYLDEQWGLAEGRQDAVVLAAVSVPPTARLADEAQARGFWDQVARQYLAASGLPLEDQRTDPANGPAPDARLIDSSALNALTKTRHALDQSTLRQYAKQLGVDLNGKAKAEAAAQEAISELQRQLDQWSNEHGEDYATGIKPIFDPRKARFFESSWAWIIQDVLSAFYAVLRGQTPPGEILRRIRQNRDPKIHDILSYLRSVCNASANASATFETARVLVESLLLDDGERDNQAIHGPVKPASAPCSQIKRMEHGAWRRDDKATRVLIEAQTAASEDSSLFLDGRKILLTGAGPGSIGADLLRRLLRGGACVAVTTSRYSPATVAFFRDIYVAEGAQGSRLVVVPFNQGSQQDIHSLVSWIYDTKGLGWDVDAIIPFAALSESGREIDEIDSKSELAHRVMLTNTIRLIGAVKAKKQAGGFHNCPAQVILPLSANHGLLGGDGLYGESKIGLEALFQKWESESWGSYLSVAGAGIGWTRGTGLMKDLDGFAQAMETELSLQTFSQADMATNLLSLFHPDLMEVMEARPIYADFNGGLDTADNVSGTFRQQRQLLSEENEIKAAIAAEDALEKSNSPAENDGNQEQFHPRANMQLQFPRLPRYDSDLKPLESLQGMVNLESVVVIAGFSELGPWGSSRTRWEMESRGTFSIEGWVEMAWIMGCIKYSHVGTASPEDYIGWIDSKTGTPVEDHEIQEKYGEFILAHTGIRIVESEIWGNYDPERKEFFQEIVVEADIEPFDASEDSAAAMKKRHGSHIDWVDGKIYIKKGATIMVPKVLKFDHNVNGQIPTGWDPRTYGISEQIIAQVDRITLFSVVCAVEALFVAGITDPYEIYRHIHTSQLGNCLGTGVGGVTSAAKMYKGRSMEQHDVAQDVLQETFLNTPAAWVNMLLLSSNGPIRTPVGACATALESLDTAFDLIINGKAKMCLVGGVDDLEEHMAYEFANMKATNNNELDAECGRDPSQMSRPTASDRRGFIESHGCGIQIVCTAKLALEMGLPVYGIVAFSGTSSDKVGRSVPAPGKGVMVNARERPAAFPSSLLNLEYRRRQISLRRKQIGEARELELAHLAEEIAAMDVGHPATKEFEAYRAKEIQDSAARQEADALRAFGTDFWRQNAEIAPLRGALAAWGLTIDDLQVASFHGTSTVKNELNECDIMQSQLAHLGRTPGNRILGVFQKHLTGHPKGAAGAWMLNGCLQIMDTGLVPGNSNADNIDPKLEQFDHIAFLNRPIQTDGIKAASVFSFGFGQKGTQAVVVHPKYLFATLREDEYEVYCTKTRARRRVAAAEFRRRMVEGRVVAAKETPPFDGTEESAALVDPGYRVHG